MGAALLLVAVLLTLAAAIVVGTLVGGPVQRHRLFLFAHRQALVITPENGNLVVRYLAVTRRWRTLGLLAGVVVAGAWSFRDGELRVNFLAAFAGWFVGAVVAEWRVLGAHQDVRRVAALSPRLLHQHVGRIPRSLPWTASAVALGLSVTSLIDAALGGSSVDVPAVLLWSAVAAAGLAVPLAVARHVLERPRPPDLPPDVLAADDAVRRRSLHVLAGSSLALIAYPTAGLIEHLPWAESVGGVLTIIFVAPAVVGGWLVARTPARLQPAGVPVAAA